jgi:hypothetical protein
MEGHTHGGSINVRILDLFNVKQREGLKTDCSWPVVAFQLNCRLSCTRGGVIPVLGHRLKLTSGPVSFHGWREIAVVTVGGRLQW